MNDEEKTRKLFVRLKIACSWFKRYESRPEIQREIFHRSISLIKEFEDAGFDRRILESIILFDTFDSYIKQNQIEI